jgi:hypothetical protein
MLNFMRFSQKEIVDMENINSKIITKTKKNVIFYQNLGTLRFYKNQQDFNYIFFILKVH